MGTESPNKKRKSEQDNHDSSFETDLPGTYDDEYDEVMPGFHEHNEDDVGLSLEDPELVEPELEEYHDMDEGSRLKSAPPKLPSSSVLHTAPRSTSSLHPISARKPLSTQGLAREPEVINSVPTETETHSCPVCGKTLQTDNTGLNTHIDFCLSRGAIREAQTGADNLNTKPSGGLQWGKEGADKSKIASGRKKKKV